MDVYRQRCDIYRVYTHLKPTSDRRSLVIYRVVTRAPRAGAPCRLAAHSAATSSFYDFLVRTECYDKRGPPRNRTGPDKSSLPGSISCPLSASSCAPLPINMDHCRANLCSGTRRGCCNASTSLSSLLSRPTSRDIFIRLPVIPAHSLVSLRSSLIPLISHRTFDFTLSFVILFRSHHLVSC